MAKTDKVATVAEITDRFRSSSAAVVTEYRGLTMAQLTELRRSLGKDTAYTVAKNTLVKRAAADAGVEGLDDLFVGPTAVAFISGEPVDAAKALRDFAKTHPLLVIKGGLLDGRPIEPGEVNKLADLESREVLLGKLAGAMLGTLTKAAYVLNALPSQVARLAAALQDKRVADGETLEVATEAAAVEAAAEAVAEVAVVEAAEEAVVDAVAEDAAVLEAAVVEAAVEEVTAIEAVAEEVLEAEAVSGDSPRTKPQWSRRSSKRRPPKKPRSSRLRPRRSRSSRPPPTRSSTRSSPHCGLAVDTDVAEIVKDAAPEA